MNTRYQIGDILTDGHNHILIEDIEISEISLWSGADKQIGYYILLRLEDGAVIHARTEAVDENRNLKLVQEGKGEQKEQGGPHKGRMMTISSYNK